MSSVLFNVQVMSMTQHTTARRRLLGPCAGFLRVVWFPGSSACFSLGVCLLLMACLWPVAPALAAQTLASDGDADYVSAHSTDAGNANPVAGAQTVLHWAPAFGLELRRATRTALAVKEQDLQLAGNYGIVPGPHLAHKPVSMRQSSAMVRRWCHALAARLASVGRQTCLNKGFIYSGYRTVQGRPIVVREVHSRQVPAVGRVLLIGGIHGDELSAVSLVFKWLNDLLASGSDYTWHVVPSLNPDGLLDGKPQRGNAHGVDLNRNLPTAEWRQKSENYWRKVDYSKRRYPGKSPASEPETQWLVDEIDAFRPDVIISVHAPYGVLDYDGELPAPRKLGSLGLHQLGVYPGSLGNYASHMLGIPVITIELDNAWKLPTADDIMQMWHDLNGWLLRYVGEAFQVNATAREQSLG